MERYLQLAGAEKLPLLQFPILSDTKIVEHAFTTRDGGVSEGIFESLNLSYTRGDNPEAVTENYRRVANALHTDIEHIVCSDQTHTTNVRVVTERDAGKGVVRQRDYVDIDGLITNVKGLLLATFYADCVPLYFVDPVKEAIGLSHSGWRGTVGRMGAHTIDAMTENFGCDTRDIKAVIGPCICKDCYEISADVAEQFQREFGEHAKEILTYRGIRDGEEKYHLDLWKANEVVLLEAGIRPQNLLVSGVCTCCNAKRLFSHRASQGRRGNLGAFLMLK